MKRKSGQSLGLSLGVVALFLLQAGAVVHADCRDIVEQSRGAAEELDTVVLSRLHDEAAFDDHCSHAFRRWLGKQLAIAHVSRARLQLQGQDRAAAVSSLDKALAADRYWMALAMMGDVEAEQRQYARASLYYQEALDEISDREETVTPPPPEIIGKVYKKAEQSRLLAASYVHSPSNRAGKAGGLAGLSFRGFTPKQVAIPVSFVYDSSTFTAKGEEAVSALFRELSEQGQPDITLVGHTDPIGSEAYNEQLSLQRAEAVERYLRAASYGGRIQVEARGEREPYQLADGADYSQEEWYQMCRRVELKRQ
ncbi:OmpA family protein [Desulfogranum mediterraneum]|uniref:OmpA family protein n=1 Tax=Desulfogranum mediterraneum TaxID=160661 RepID=UPI000418ACF7|nr:OmpA family protein [Desulfogranum mediterraneum]